jgi:hypothetical protein
VPEDDGLTIIPLGGGSGAAVRAAQFSSATADFLRRFANNPAALVISVVSGFVVSVVLGFFEFLIGAVLYPFDLLVGGLHYVQHQLVLAFSALGIDLIGVLAELERSLIAVVESAGPGGPVLAAAIAGMILFVVYRVTVAGLRLVPGGSSVLALLGK